MINVPSDWKQIALGSVCDINPRLKQRPMPDTKVSFIPMDGVSNSGKLNYYLIRRYEEVSKGFTPFSENDILFAKITPCMENGKGAHANKLTNGIGFGSTEFHVLRAKDNIDSRYIYQLVHWKVFRLQAEANMTGSAGQRRVPTDFLSDYQLLLPPLSEQKIIAEILSSIDRSIEATEKLIAKLADLKKALMQELFTKGLPIEALAKLGIKTPRKFKDSLLGRIPEEWEVVVIGDIAKIKTGDKDTQDKIDNGKYPFLVRSQIVERINSYSFDGEAVLTAGDGVGTGKVFHYLNGKFDYHQRVYNIHDFCPKILGKFFFEYFSLNFLSRVQQLSAKGSVDSVRMEMISQMYIPLPSIEEQKQIVGLLSSTSQKIDMATNRLTKLQSLKKGLMQDLLTGKVRVFDKGSRSSQL